MTNYIFHVFLLVAIIIMLFGLAIFGFAAWDAWTFVP